MDSAISSPREDRNGYLHERRVWELFRRHLYFLIITIFNGLRRNFILNILGFTNCLLRSCDFELILKYRII